MGKYNKPAGSSKGKAPTESSRASKRKKKPSIIDESSDEEIDAMFED
jgi:hypothetical protein